MGRRGLWVERRRGTVERSVIGFDAPPIGPRAANTDDNVLFFTGEDEPSAVEHTRDSDEEDVDEDEDEGEQWLDTTGQREIEGHKVFEVKSYDLRGLSAVPCHYFPSLTTIPPGLCART